MPAGPPLRRRLSRFGDALLGAVAALSIAGGAWLWRRPHPPSEQDGHRWTEQAVAMMTDPKLLFATEPAARAMFPARSPAPCSTKLNSGSRPTTMRRRPCRRSG